MATVAVVLHGLLGAPAPAGLATAGTSAGSGATGGRETVHPTANHPWLTADRGWVPAGDLKAGERVLTLDGGTTGTVAWVHTVAGAADMYNLTVADDHTYAVGDGQWVVHNDSVDPLKLIRSLANAPDIISRFGGALTHVANQHSYMRYLAYMYQAGGNESLAEQNFFITPITGTRPPSKEANSFFPSGVDPADMQRIGKALPGVDAEDIAFLADQSTGGSYVYKIEYQQTEYQLALGVDENGPYVKSWYPTKGEGVYTFENPCK